MRFIVRIIFPTEVGNKAVSDPNFLKNIQGFIENNRAEASILFSTKWRKERPFRCRCANCR